MNFGRNVMKKHAGGCKWIIIPEEDRYVSLVVTKKNRNATPTQIAVDLAIATSRHVSARTI